MKIAGATSVASYLAKLPADRRAIVARVRDEVNAVIPAGYVESLGYGMIMWSIPLSRFPNTYNGQPICTVALAAQKHYYALYLMGCYGNAVLDAELRAGFARDGKTLDMGKSCVRFTRVEDLSLPAVARVIGTVTPEMMMEWHEMAHSPAATAKRRAARREAAPAPTQAAKTAAARKPAAKTAAARKPAAKKPAAKRPAVKKSVRRKPAPTRAAAKKRAR